MAKYSSKAKSAAAKARKAVQDARAKVEEVKPKARAFYEDDDYTPEGKAKYGGGWLRDGRQGVERLEAIRTPDPDELQARTAIFSPVLAAATETPDALINAYRKRSGNMADRRILEETAQAMIDAQIGGLKFLEDFNRARSAVELAPEEADAAAEVAYLEEVENYTASAAAILEADLRGVEGALSVQDQTRLAPAYANVNRFENAE